MNYMGGKTRLVKYLKPIIQTLIDKNEIENYIEPFVGGINVIKNIKCSNKYGYDNNQYVIALYKAIQNGWEPWNTDITDKMTKEIYNNIRDNKDKYSQELVGLVGVLCSYRGKWFGGYTTRGTNLNERDRFAESLRMLAKEQREIFNINFDCKDYRDITFPSHALVYCDPPYERTVGYKDKFDHSSYWNWVRDISKTPIIVLCSEYNAPNDFIEIFTKDNNTTIASNLKGNGTSKKVVEKLFIYENSYFLESILNEVGLLNGK